MTNLSLTICHQSDSQVCRKIVENCNKTILRIMANIDLKIDTLIAEIRNIKLMATKTTDKEIKKTERQILKGYPLLTEADLIKEKRLSTDIHYKNNLVSIIL